LGTSKNPDIPQSQKEELDCAKLFLKRSRSYGDRKFCARLLLFLAPVGHYSKSTTASLKPLKATSSSCVVLPCISTFAIMLRYIRVFRGAHL